MAADRYVILGLAHPRAPWFTDVARWATAGVAPLEFVKCLSAREVATRLGSERQFSALLVDASATGVDRDLLDLASQRGCAVVIVGDGPQGWQALGAAAALPAAFDRAPLLAALAEHAVLINDARASAGDAPPPPPVTPWRGQLIAVTGVAGSGVSTVAMALAQGLADDVRHAGMVLLADLALDADLAMFHDVRDLVPGLPELVEAHRHTRLGPTELRALTFDIVVRKYRLLLGLRQHRDWTALPTRAVESALDSARGAFHTVVADIDAEVEGEAETGAADIEDRNRLARIVASQADVVVVVGEPGLKGVFALDRVLGRLRAFGIPGERLLPVLNRAPRSARARSESNRAFTDLTGAVATSVPVPLPERRDLDDVHRSAGRLPRSLTDPLSAAVGASLERLPSGAEPLAAEPPPITPGSLGTWTDEEAVS